MRTRRWARVVGRIEDQERRIAAAQRLASGLSIDERVAVVVAHADDETLWAGAALGRCRDLLLIHATDSAPEDMSDAGRLGFARREDYAAARAAELDRALAILGAAPERVGFGIPDQEAAYRLDELTGRLAQHLAGCAIVATHPYEGGHPDHDALALAVALAVRRLDPAPAIVEFACYHEVKGQRQFGRFWPDPRSPEQVRALDPAERARVAAAVEAHATQAGVVGDWRPAAERWRAAPAYDFAAAPPPGQALYDRFGWTITSARWRALAREAMEAELLCA